MFIAQLLQTIHAKVISVKAMCIASMNTYFLKDNINYR